MNVIGCAVSIATYGGYPHLPAPADEHSLWSPSLGAWYPFLSSTENFDTFNGEEVGNVKD